MNDLQYNIFYTPTPTPTPTPKQTPPTKKQLQKARTRKERGARKEKEQNYSHTMLTTQDLVGYLGLFSAFFLFCSPLPTMRTIRTSRRVLSFSPDPYLISSMNCASWVFYAIITPDRLQPLITNLIGVAFNLSYSVVFLKSIHPELDTPSLALRTSRKIFALVAIYLLLLGTTLLLLPKLTPKLYLEPTSDMDALLHTQSELVGLFAAAQNILMYAGPLTVMSQVIRTKSVEFMPLPLTMGTLFCSGSWFWYGLLTDDLNILIPNITGLFLGAIQVAIYLKYYNNYKEKNSIEQIISDNKNLLDDDDDDLERVMEGRV